MILILEITLKKKMRLMLLMCKCSLHAEFEGKLYFIARIVVTSIVDDRGDYKFKICF